MRINSKEKIQYGGPDSTEAKDTKTQKETSLGIGVGELKKIQYGGLDTTEAQDTRTQNETSLGPLGIGGGQDSFETAPSIPDGTSKGISLGPVVGTKGIILQKDVSFVNPPEGDVKGQNAMADGSVLEANLDNLSKELESRLKSSMKLRG